MIPRVYLLAAAALLSAVSAACSGPAAQRLRPEDFLPDMNQPVEPVHIIGNIYYVGTNGVSSFLLTTPEGHILIDSGFNQSVPLIRDSVTKLGFRFEDIRILLSSHAHFDHVAGHAWIQEQTNAQVIASELDGKVIARGDEALWSGWRAARVDRIIADGDRVELGSVELTAPLTPGHTKGCTTWTMDVAADSQTYRVLFLGGAGINPGVRLVGDPAYPNMAEDFERTFQVLNALDPEVFLAQHPEIFRLNEKVKRRQAGARENPFIDPDGYRRRIKESEDAFRDQLQRERSTTPTERP